MPNILDKLTNTLNGYVADAKNIKGTYVVVEDYNELLTGLPSACLVNGMLAYCQSRYQSHEAGFYQLQGGVWEPVSLENKVIQITIEESFDITQEYTFSISQDDIIALAYAGDSLQINFSDGASIFHPDFLQISQTEFSSSAIIILNDTQYIANIIFDFSSQTDNATLSFQELQAGASGGCGIGTDDGKLDFVYLRDDVTQIGESSTNRTGCLVYSFPKGILNTTENATLINQVITGLNSQFSTDIPTYTTIEDLVNIFEYVGSTEVATALDTYYDMFKLVFYSSALMLFNELSTSKCMRLSNYGTGGIPTSVENAEVDVYSGADNVTPFYEYIVASPAGVIWSADSVSASFVNSFTLTVNEEYTGQSSGGSSGGVTQDVSLIDSIVSFTLEQSDVDLANATTGHVDLTSSGQAKILPAFQKARELLQADKLGLIKIKTTIADLKLIYDVGYVSGSTNLNINENFQIIGDDIVIILTNEIDGDNLAAFIGPLSLGLSISFTIEFYKKDIQVASGSSYVVDLGTLTLTNNLASTSITQAQYDNLVNASNPVITFTYNNTINTCFKNQEQQIGRLLFFNEQFTISVENDGTVYVNNIGYAIHNPLTTKGDLIVANQFGEPVRLAKGTTGQVLEIDSNGDVGWGNAKQDKLTTSSVSNGTIANLIGFNSSGDVVKQIGDFGGIFSLDEIGNDVNNGFYLVFDFTSLSGYLDSYDKVITITPYNNDRIWQSIILDTHLLKTMYLSNGIQGGRFLYAPEPYNLLNGYGNVYIGTNGSAIPTTNLDGNYLIIFVEGTTTISEIETEYPNVSFIVKCH